MSSTRIFPALALTALFIGGAAIGLGAIMMRLSDVNPVASAFWRMALAAPVLWVWAFAVSPQDRANRMHTGFTPAVALAGIYFAGDMGFWHLSLHFTTVANATLLTNLAPVGIALWLWIVYKVRFAPQFLLGVGVALAGAMLLVGSNVGASPAGGGTLMGDTFGLVSAGFYAAYQLTIKAARSNYSTARLMAWSTSFTALVLLPFALLTDGPFWPAEPAGWWPLLGLAAIAQVGGQTVIAYASAHLPASLSSIGLLVQPLVATIAAWLLFSEAVAPLQMLGGALLLTGIYLSKRGS